MMTCQSPRHQTWCSASDSASEVQVIPTRLHKRGKEALDLSVIDQMIPRAPAFSHQQSGRQTAFSVASRWAFTGLRIWVFLFFLPYFHSTDWEGKGWESLHLEEEEWHEAATGLISLEPGMAMRRMKEWSDGAVCMYQTQIEMAVGCCREAVRSFECSASLLAAALVKTRTSSFLKFLRLISKFLSTK